MCLAPCKVDELEIFELPKLNKLDKLEVIQVESPRNLAFEQVECT